MVAGGWADGQSGGGAGAYGGGVGVRLAVLPVGSGWCGLPEFYLVKICCVEPECNSLHFQLVEVPRS